MEDVIETDQLTSQYAAATVVDHVCLHVSKGKIVSELSRTPQMQLHPIDRPPNGEYGLPCLIA